MLRQLHSLPGLFAAVLVMLLALSALLPATQPALERLDATLPAAGQVNVADLAERVARHYPGVERIERTPNGAVIVHFEQAGEPGSVRVDPFSGQGIAAHEPSDWASWSKELHRSLLLGTPGRALVAAAALCMLLLSLSGAALLAKRQGGWGKLLRPLQGNLSQRWHAEVGRLAIVGLLLSALSGLYLSAVSFELLSDGMDVEAEFPQALSTAPAAPLHSLAALRATDLNDLRELAFPAPGEPNDAYRLSTAQGDGYVDQASGAQLSFTPHNSARRLYELIYRLHTGEGLWWLGLLLGLGALSVPLMSLTGVRLWWRRRQAMPRLANNGAVQSADTVILVGSENHATWGFAKALHAALNQAGLRVHTAPMNQLRADYPRAERLFILTATYGDGGAPACASQFLARLGRIAANPRLHFAVLGFGDRQFPRFCQFARDCDAALAEHGWPRLLALETIDRQCAQAFARWGNTLGRRLGRELNLHHSPQQPPTRTWQLVERVQYGEQVQAPTSVLRFTATAPTSAGNRLQRWLGGNRSPRFEAGDLVGIVPPGSPLPRFYSLASACSDGVLEICVRKHANGLCSGFLHDLPLGGRIEAFIQANPDFRPASGKHPVVLIGAGTGIGPLTGFIRHNKARHPMHLYWGGRSPDSDFLYQPELNDYLADQRLTRLHTAFSRAGDCSHVQQRLSEDATQLRRLIDKGAQILVCGSREMAKGVMQALDQVLAPLDLDVPTLKAQGRYREDVY
ncbi:putative Oxidoreductase, FAD-binding [Pseudomonas sp. 8AS]|uniref:PepSY domain-containing protein n=1 Tax=Pseudomonas sp. 8AS TaxID=2653163 RepID=UPI0012F3AF6A|nr:PepSY domain-containing protein [Pseudomonas sp. 8AS]VXC04067.1 putative Oxidoreductase, FAD-binding [Pseudomonas sp. 8AS]